MQNKIPCVHALMKYATYTYVLKYYYKTIYKGITDSKTYPSGVSECNIDGKHVKNCHKRNMKIPQLQRTACILTNKFL